MDPTNQAQMITRKRPDELRKSLINSNRKISQIKITAIIKIGITQIIITKEITIHQEIINKIIPYSYKEITATKTAAIIVKDRTISHLETIIVKKPGKSTKLSKLSENTNL